MTGSRQVVVTPEGHIEKVLRLEAERDDWERKRPSWRVYISCAVGALAGSALFPFARGVLLGFVVAGIIVVPAQLLARRIQLQSIDRRLKQLREGAAGSLSSGESAGGEDREASRRF